MAQAARSLPSAPYAEDVPRLRVVPPPARPRRPSAAVIRRRRAVALGGLVALVLLAVAALSIDAGPSDAARIGALLSRGAADPASLCDHLSGAMLAAAGGHTGCVRSSPSRGPSATVDGIRISGDRATAVVHHPEADETVSLVREDGDWKVADVR
jgi:hypothetical protein